LGEIKSHWEAGAIFLLNAEERKEKATGSAVRSAEYRTRNAESATSQSRSRFGDSASHVAQVLGYLKSARLEHGLLINFGSYKFEMRKFAWSQDGTCRKSKPTFLLSAVSAFFAFFAV